jgi:hypothetical protein
MKGPIGVQGLSVEAIMKGESAWSSLKRSLSVPELVG